MKSILWLISILVTPIIIISIIAILKYGIDGPADNDKVANKLFEIIGMTYGVYAALVIIYWKTSVRNRK
jgi:hypothetical protein